MSNDFDIAKAIETSARSGDGHGLVAYAILQLASEVRTLNENLTFGDGSSDRVQGCLEKIAIAVTDIADSMPGGAA